MCRAEDSRSAALLPTSSPTDHRQFPLWPFRRFNRNVVLTWFASLLQMCGDSIWNGGPVLASFIYELMGHKQGNAYVGYVEAAQGLINLIVALPVGYIADKYSKSAIVFWGAAAVPVAGAATIFAAFYGVAHESHVFVCYWLLFGAMCIWGFAYAVFGGPAQALFADSTPTGQRSWHFTKLAQIGFAASTVGPAVAVAMFALHGDTWSTTTLRNVLVVGVAIEVPMAFPMMLLRDDCALEAGGGSAAEETTPAPVVDSCAQGCSGGGSAEPAGDEAAASESADAAHKASEESPHIWMVPYVLFASALLLALGSGMTIKFFPLFFKNDLQLSPVYVQLIYLLVPIWMGICSDLGERAARVIGRVTVMVSFKIVGIGLLVSMALLRDWVAPESPAGRPNATDADELAGGWEAGSGGGGGSGGGVDVTRVLKVVLTVAIYLMRTTLMNCTYPIEEAVLMDYVPPGTRARWKALDSISSFGWCGSAAIGGLIADAYDYSTTFLITAALQGAGVAVCALLFFVIPRSRDVESRSGRAEETGSGTSPSTGASVEEVLVEPLVAATPAGSIQAADA